MSKTTKKILIITGLALDVAITIFLFVVSIIMIVTSVTTPAYDLKNMGGLIGYLVNHLPVYLGAFVVPMFILLAVNIVGLVIYVKKTSAKKQNVTVNDLTEEQKEALKKELLKDLNNEK